MKCKTIKTTNAAIVIHLLILMDFAVSFFEDSIELSRDSVEDWTVDRFRSKADLMSIPKELT